jgi:hypothetical protein
MPANSRRIALFAIANVFALAAAGTGAARASSGTEPAPPPIDGLVAWYDVRSLHRSHRDGAPVASWPDASGKGHGLTLDEGGDPALFQAGRDAGLPHVLVGERGAYSVASPFRLEDHTIVLVYAAERPGRALLRSDVEEGRGIVLRADSRRDQYQTGGAAGGRTFAYGQSIGRSEGSFDVTILARREGVFRQFENGSDVSTGIEEREPIRVGKLFDLYASQYVRLNGHGLRIAEMLFYDRYLSAAERRAVLEYVEQRHGIVAGTRRDLPLPDGRTHRVRLRTDRAASLGAVPAEEGAAAATATIAWNLQDVLAPPFRHDAELAPERLGASRDGTQSAITLILPVLASVPGTSVRVLLLVNGERYLPRDLKSGELPVEGGPPAVLQLDADIELDAGDFLTVVASPAGPPGASVRLVPDGALLVVPGP